jgi:hypothetical protein
MQFRLEQCDEFTIPELPKAMEPRERELLCAKLNVDISRGDISVRIVKDFRDTLMMCTPIVSDSSIHFGAVHQLITYLIRQEWHDAWDSCIITSPSTVVSELLSPQCFSSPSATLLSMEEACSRWDYSRPLVGPERRRADTSHSMQERPSIHSPSSKSQALPLSLEEMCSCWDYSRPAASISGTCDTD